MRGFRSADFLKLIGAVDQTPRVVGKRELISVRCTFCQVSESEQLMQVLQAKAYKKNEGWRCAPCGAASGAERRKLVGPPAQGTSRKASAFRTEEVLKMAKALNCEPRVIRGEEFLEAYCWDCNAVGKAKMNNQIQRLKNRGYTWRCPKCVKDIMSVKASQKTGKLNSFYGKTHSDETKEIIAQKQTENQAKIPAEQKSAIGKIGMAAAVEKYGGNPMSNEEIRAKHYEATHTNDFIEWARKLGLSAVTEEFKHFMRIQSQKYWASSEGEDQKKHMSDFYSKAFNYEGGKFYEIRKKMLAEFHSDTSRLATALSKMKATNLTRYGHENVMSNPEIRRKSLSKKPKTSPEKYLCEMFLQRGIPFEYGEIINGKCWDFCVYSNSGELVLIVEIDGEYNHGLKCDPFYANVGGHKDNERFSLVPDGVIYIEVDSLRVKESIPYIVEMIGIDYSKWISDIFLECSSMDFPYPQYSAKRMTKDWLNLKRLYTDRFYSSKMPGNSIITSFHKSIYSSRVGTRRSPIEAWNDPVSLLSCIENRFVYKSNLSAQQIARGFERNKIAPRVTVFQPGLARYLLAKYAPGMKSVVDPFSGFSGRMLGALSLGMDYKGYDIRQETINESNSILSFLDLSAQMQVADFNANIDDNIYDVLLTCPPYGNKEKWFDDQDCRPTEWYIKECLSKFKAKVYVFVVDDPGEFSGDVKELIGRKSHLSDSDEKVVVICR